MIKMYSIEGSYAKVTQWDYFSVEEAMSKGGARYEVVEPVVRQFQQWNLSFCQVDARAMSVSPRRTIAKVGRMAFGGDMWGSSSGLSLASSSFRPLRYSA